MKLFRFSRAAKGMLWAALVLGVAPATAADLALSGIVGGKAILVIDNKPPQLLAVGKTTADGVRLLAIEGDTALVEVDGRRLTLRLGARVVRQSSPEGAGAGGNAGIHSGLTGEAARKVLARGLELVIEADEHGQFLSAGEINGSSVHFLVDTGASVVAIGRSTALRLGIHLDATPDGRAQTAGGVVLAWRVTLRSLKVGSMRFDNVDAIVSEADMPHVLLGMNVLEQMEMRRNGREMRLKKKL